MTDKKYTFGHSDDQNIFLTDISFPSTVPEKTSEP